MIILSASDLRKALPMGQAIEAMRRAYAAFSSGHAQVPLRIQLDIPLHNGISLFMPAYVHDDKMDALAVKVVSLFSGNPARALPLIHAAVLAFEPETGRLLALIEGGALTAIRTGAASGAATDLLARPDCRVAAVFGAGVQGRTQLEAVCTIRPIETAWIYDPRPERVQAFIAEMSGFGPIPTDLRAARSPHQAVASADVICTATTSTTPVFSNTSLQPGAHINAVGSYTPTMQENHPETLARALLVVDSREACAAEAGDLIQAIEQGYITRTHIHAELGEIVLQQKSARSGREQITFFKSVGIAVQDAISAQLALENALSMQIGQQIDW